MKRKRYIFCFLCFLGLCFPAFPQPVSFTGSVQIGHVPDRKTFRPSKAVFESRALHAEVKVSAPVNAVLYLKGKDGVWFQSEKNFMLKSGQWTTLEVPVDERYCHFLSPGGSAVFDEYAVSTVFEYGVSLYSPHQGTVKAECRNLGFTGKRRVPELAVIDWKMPETGKLYGLVESTFRLSRSYFNVFDPEEIAVDFELQTPDGKCRKYPAFHTCDFERSHHFTKETLTRSGPGYWAFRFTPQKPGKYRARLHIKDCRSPNPYVSSWKEFQTSGIADLLPVGKKSAEDRYFSRADGKTFFPVGLNIHTNSDIRCELSFEFGHIPDCGLADYERYFRFCRDNGINLVEVWMAAWMGAIEHSSEFIDFYGLGFYSLSNAWKIDQILQEAAKNGIFVNLVLDNHGRLSPHTDSEWNDNPFNAKAPYAKANGAFLEKPEQFFSDEKAWHYVARRNRYLAARYGAYPNVFAFEQWSEIDLVANAKELYKEGIMQKFLSRTIADLKRQSQCVSLYGVHTCGTYKNMLQYRQIYELPEVTHVAGDAYRPNDKPFFPHLEDYDKNMDFQKPQLITEFGGQFKDHIFERLTGDVRSGLWGSLFIHTAGAPMLWWHEAVFRKNMLQYYRAFASFIKNLDLAERKIIPAEFAPGQPETENYYLKCASAKDVIFGYAGHKETLLISPAGEEEVTPLYNTVIRIPGLVPGRKYQVRFYRTRKNGECFREYPAVVPQSGTLSLLLPPLRMDCAFQIGERK